jgi:hypothetical protein
LGFFRCGEITAQSVKIAERHKGWGRKYRGIYRENMSVNNNPVPLAGVYLGEYLEVTDHIHSFTPGVHRGIFVVILCGQFRIIVGIVF